MKTSFVPCLIASLGFCVLAVRADQIEMQNGDRYVARIVSMTNDMVVVQSDVLGTVSLPRGKVAAIRMGTNATAVAISTLVGKTARPAGSGNLAAAANPAQVTTQASALQQVQDQYLKDADPAAKAKFNELLTGVQTGKITESDLRGQAQSMAAQLKGYKRDLGPEAGELLDGYLTVLESFLNDTKGVGATTNNATAALMQKFNELPKGED